jgi:histidyl-tRNA synthetase
MFRHERPQAGRYRQFYQLGVEMLGGSADRGQVIYNDLQAIKSAVECLERIGLTDLTVEINNLGGKETLKAYNQYLLTELAQAELSDLSMARVAAGHALRVLDSKSE